jgi:hypothetical protein
LVAFFICYWLLLRGGIVQSVPCTAAIFWSILRPHLTSNHSWFIHQRSLAKQTPCSGTGRNVLEFTRRSICHSPQGSLTCPKILRHGADGFTPPPKEVVLLIFIARPSTCLMLLKYINYTNYAVYFASTALGGRLYTVNYDRLSFTLVHHAAILWLITARTKIPTL